MLLSVAKKRVLSIGIIGQSKRNNELSPQSNTNNNDEITIF